MKFDKATLARIAPGTGDHLKYSPRLYSWVKKHAHWDLEAFAVDRRPHGGKEGVVYLGRMTSDGLIGRSINTILSEQRGQNYSYLDIQADTHKPIPDFWERYFKWGRCALDPEHKVDYLDDRWEMKLSGKHRECLWCGHCQEKVTFIHTEERSRWENSSK